MKDKNTPITLSGRAFVDKLLAMEREDLALPERLSPGDLKFICIADRKAANAGFFTAYVFDGKGWRKFSLRDKAKVIATYGSNAQRLSRMSDAARDLRKLKDYPATWGHKSYEVLVTAKPVVTQTPVAPQVAANSPAVVASLVTSQPVPSAVAANVASVASHRVATTGSGRGRGKRSRKSRHNPNQMELFQ